MYLLAVDLLKQVVSTSSESISLKILSSDESFLCSLRVSDRARRIRIQVQPGKVRVTVPQGVPLELARLFIQDRAAWIADRLALYRNNPGPSSEYEPVPGSTIWFMGEERTITVFNGEPPGAVPAEEFPVPVDALSRHGIRALLDEALLLSVERSAGRFRELTGKGPSSVRLGNAATRWGSCSTKGVVMVNRKLVHAPVHIIEYIVFHEINHLRFPDHSRGFWQGLEALFPDVAGAKRWLRLQGAHLIS